MNENDNASKRLISHSIEAVLGSKWHALDRYLSKMEEYLKEGDKEFSREYGKIKKTADRLPAELHTEVVEFLAETYSHYSIDFPNILHNSFLISVISLFEFEIGTICERLKREQNIPISWRDLKGDTLERAKRFFKIAGIDVNFENANWKNINYFYLIRNCIVHNNGIIEGTRDEDKLRPYLLQKQIISKDEDEDEIVLKNSFCKEILDDTQQFLNNVWDNVYSLPPIISK